MAEINTQSLQAELEKMNEWAKAVVFDNDCRVLASTY